MGIDYWGDGAPVIQASVAVGGMEYYADGQPIDVISTAGMARYLQTAAQIATSIPGLMAHIFRPLAAVSGGMVVDIPDLIVGGAASYAEDPGFRTAPNVPYFDPYCRARWRFEYGDSFRDSINGFTLTQGNGAIPQSNHVEGSMALGLNSANQNYLWRSNANMPSWFPFKSGGTMKGAIVFFMYQTNTYSTTTQIDIGGIVRLDTFQNYTYWKWGTGSQTIWSGGTLVSNQWYICILNIDGPRGHCVLYRWPCEGGSGGHTLFSDASAVTDATGDFIVGARGPQASIGSYMNGAIDDLMVFDRLLTIQEMWLLKNYYFHGPYPRFQDYQKFQDDPDCVGLYLFQPHATNKGIATKGVNWTPSQSNDTQNQSIAYGTKEPYATWCYSYGGVPGYTITDSNLPSGFPFKNGDTGKKMTMCLWMRQARGYSGSDSYGDIIRKHYSNDNNSFRIYTDVADQHLKIRWGYNTGNYTIDTGITILEYSIYHVAVMLDGINKSIAARVYDFYANTTYTYSTTVENGLYLNTETLYLLDGGGTADLAINCLSFFKRILTDAEIDAIRDGLYNYVQDRQLSTDCGAVVDATAQARIYRPFATDCQMSAGGVYGRPRRLITQAGGRYQEWLGSRNINASLLPTSADGLLSGALWVDNGKIKRVP